MGHRTSDKRVKTIPCVYAMTENDTNKYISHVQTDHEERSEKNIYEYTAIFVTIIIFCCRVFFVWPFFSTLALSLHVVSSARARMKEYGTWSQCIGSNRNNHVCRYERINSS